MAPALLPAQIGQECAACTVLGACLGTVRAFFPQKGRAAVLPDLVWVGALLLGLQSYAAGCSAGGLLRWYMIVCALAAAFAAAGVFGIPLRWAGRLLARAAKVPLRFGQKWVLEPLRQAHAARANRRRLRQIAKRSEKNAKKNLPKDGRMLYNSNV